MTRKVVNWLRYPSSNPEQGGRVKLCLDCGHRVWTTWKLYKVSRTKDSARCRECEKEQR